MSWIIEDNLDPKLQDWGEAYKELCAIIKAKVPEVKHIDFYYGQDQFVEQDGKWNPFTCPAVLLNFRTAEVRDLGDNTQQLTMDITMYLYMETVQDTHHGSAGQRRAMEFVGLMRKLHLAMHGTSGDHFSPLSRVDMAQKTDAPPYAYVFGQTYRCVLIDNSTSKQYDFAEPGTLGLEIEPHTAPPPPVGRLVIVRNSDDTYHIEVEAPDEHVLPDVTHVDSNGVEVVLPATKPFTATQCDTPPDGVVIDEWGEVVLRVPSGGTVPLPGIAIEYEDKDGIVQYTEEYPAVTIDGQLMPNVSIGMFRARNGNSEILGTADITDPNVVLPKQRVRNTLGATVSLHEVGHDGVAPNSIVAITDHLGVPITGGEVPSGESVIVGIPASPITTPSGAVTQLAARTPLDVRTMRSGISYAFGMFYFNGNPSIYQAGDEGTLYASGFFDYIPPVYATHHARSVDWYTLFDNNVHGNTNRFTDRDGGQSYPNRIIQDHYTGLEWYSPLVPLTGTWSAAITASLALTHGGNNDWRVSAQRVLASIVTSQSGLLLNYAPFNLGAASTWTSTSNQQFTSNAMALVTASAWQSNAKTTSFRYLVCRRFV